MDCRKVREVVFVYTDNEMEGDLLISFREHVALCPECRRQTVYAQRLVAVVRRRCARAAAPEQLRQRILEGLRQVRAGNQSPPRA